MHTCVVGQSKLFRAALTLLLEDTVFTVATGADSLDEVSKMNGPYRRDQVVLLVQKPDNRSELSGQIEMLKARLIPPWVVFLAKTLDADEIADSFACGVDGFLLEEISPQALVNSLKLVALGEKVFPSQIVALMLASGWANRSSKNARAPYGGLLSDRELEVVNWLIRGTPNKVIAGKMSIADATVKVHVKAILRKAGVDNRTQAAIWAMQKGPRPAREFDGHSRGSKNDSASRPERYVDLPTGGCIEIPMAGNNRSELERGKMGRRDRSQARNASCVTACDTFPSVRKMVP